MQHRSSLKSKSQIEHRLQTDIRGEGNRFLAALPPSIADHIASRLKPMMLKRGSVLEHIGDDTKYLYFPTRGLISLVKVMRNGQTAEVSVIGPEGVVGIYALYGMPEAQFEIVVQLDGDCHQLRVADLRSELNTSGLRRLVLSYTNFVINRFGQSIACNRLHNMRQRCCRWLLTAGDSARSPKINITHEFLAMIMGVHRPALSKILGTMQRQHIIRNQRSAIEILDRTALVRGACECYQTLKDELKKVYGK